jgi:hypothetical protein
MTREPLRFGHVVVPFLSRRPSSIAFTRRYGRNERSIYAMSERFKATKFASGISASGLSRHFAAAQQPRRFRSKENVIFDASRHRVYEYTAQ